MPVGWECGDGWRGRRGRVAGRGGMWAVLVVGHRSRPTVAARVAGCGGRATTSSTESVPECGGRGQPSGCVVASRRTRSPLRYVAASGSVWPLRRVRARSNAWWRVRRTLDTGCGGTQWWRGCGARRVGGGMPYFRTWSGNGGVCE